MGDTATRREKRRRTPGAIDNSGRSKRCRKPPAGTSVRFGPTFVSIGSGIGGEILGFERAGFINVAYWDSCPEAITNLKQWCHGLPVHASAADPRPVQRIKELADIDLVTLSWSCKMLTTLNINASPTDERRSVGLHFLERAIEIDPAFICIENVPGLLDRRNDEHFQAILKRLRQARYSIEVHLLDSNRLGSPSRRERCIILASKLGPDILSDLAIRAGRAGDGSNAQNERTTIGQFAPKLAGCAIWGAWPNRWQHKATQSWFTADDVLPCVTGDCLNGPPDDYKLRRHDPRLPADAYIVPNARELLQLLGFPPDHPISDDIPNLCKCTACRPSAKYPRSQRARQIGNCWSPVLAQAIGEELHPYAMALHTAARATDSQRRGFKPAQKPCRWRQYRRCVKRVMLRSRVARATATGEWDDMLQHVDLYGHPIRGGRPGTPTARQVRLSEKLCKKFLQKQTEKQRRELKELGIDASYSSARAIQRTLEKLKSPEIYTPDQVLRPKDLPANINRKLQRVLDANKDAFLSHEGALPPKVCDSSGKEIVVRFKFKPDYVPQRCRCPTFAPGAAKTILLEKIAEDFVNSGMFKALPQSRWASRPLLVAKHDLNTERGGTPDSLRFTVDQVAANTQMDKITPRIRNVDHTLHRVAGHAHYVQLDIAKAFWGFGLDDESTEASAVWMPYKGQVQIFGHTRCTMGHKNSAAVMNGHYADFLRALSPEASAHCAQLADDIVLFHDDPETLIKIFAEVLQLCIRHRIKVKPKKCRALFNSVEFFGFLLDKKGKRIAPRNEAPMQRLTKPTNISELRTVLGVWNCYSQFIVSDDGPLDPRTQRPRRRYYKEIVRPLNNLTKKSTKPFTERWGHAQDAAFNKVKALFARGVHLHAWDPGRPLHFCSDASIVGYGVDLYQIGDNGEHRTIRWFNGAWTASQAKLPPFFLEGVAIIRALRHIKPYQDMSRWKLIGKSDHLPLHFLRHANGRRSACIFDLLEFQDMDYELGYISGCRNIIADGLSRCPFTGPRVPGIAGMEHMTRKLLPHVKTMLKAESIYINADHDTKIVAGIIKGRRPKRARAPNTTKSIRALLKADKPWFDSAIVIPAVEDCTFACAKLFQLGKPFACLILTTLLHRIPEESNYVVNKTIKRQLDNAAKIVFSDAEFTWVIGNTSLKKSVVLNHRANAPHQATTPHICLRSSATYASTFYPDHDGVSATLVMARQLAIQLPGLSGGTLVNLTNDEELPDLADLASWIKEQPSMVTGLPASLRGRIHYRDTDKLATYSVNGEHGRILVPTKYRKRLAVRTHEDLFHLGYRKIYSHLKRDYWWPGMCGDIKKALADCTHCALAKSKQARAQKLWRAKPALAPRSHYGFDFKQITESKAGFKQLCVCIDLCTHGIVLWAQKNRTAPTTTLGILNNVIHQRGVPLTWHSDHAKELIGNVMRDFWRPYGVNPTTTRGYSPTGNAAAERVMRHVNCCLRMLSDEQYRHWEDFLGAIQSAWNMTKHATVEFTPFEIEHGTPMRSPAAAFTAADGAIPKVTSRDTIGVIQAASAAFTAQANANAAWHKQRTAQRLNANGRPASFKIGDQVRIFIPPSSDEAITRQRATKHMVHYRGPCTITAKEGSSGYTVKVNATGAVFKRSIENIMPMSAQPSTAPEPPTVAPPVRRAPTPPTAAQCPASTRDFAIGDFIAVMCDRRDDKYWIMKVIDITTDQLTLHVHAASSAGFTAAIKPVFVTRQDQRCLRPPPGISKDQSRWTDVIPTDDLPRVVIARNLMLTAGGKLNRQSIAVLRSLPGTHTLAYLYTPT